MKSNRFKIKNWGKDGFLVEREINSGLKNFQKFKKKKKKKGKPNE